jgi:hypothetical protein
VATVVRTEGTLLVDVAAGRRLELDSLGSRVWEALVDRPTLPTLVERLGRDGPAAEQLTDEVVGLLAAWQAMGMITWR